MQPSILHTPFGEVAYRKFGRGQRVLIAFHGFSEDGAAFTTLGTSLSSSCTLYAIDLPFHGRTLWKNQDYRPKQLAVVVRAILESARSSQFEAIGHSLGARLWLHLLPEFQQQMKKLYLLAPDGLQTRWLYLAEWLPTGLRRSIIPLLSRPGWVLSLASTLHRLRFIDHFLLRYLRVHLSEEEKRKRLLFTWLSLSYFRLSGNNAHRLIRRAPIPVLVLLGDKDRLVDAETIRRRLKGLDNVRIEKVSATHRSICRVAGPFVLDL